MNKSFKSLIWVSIVAITCLGFRIYPYAGSWDIDNTSTTNAKLFVVYSNGSTTVKNDLPSGDALAGGGTVTVDQMMSSIFDDFNNIDAAFVQLVSSADADYGARATDRTITIKFDGSPGLTGGHAEPEIDGSTFVGCAIGGSEDLLDSAEAFVKTVTHELGHCLGLDHPQETVNAIMSYFIGQDIVRLQIDDKMGLVYLYPSDPDAAKESPTFGLSCARK